jgi:hypothetical protein
MPSSRQTSETAAKVGKRNDYIANFWFSKGYIITNNRVAQKKMGFFDRSQSFASSKEFTIHIGIIKKSTSDDTAECNIHSSLGGLSSSFDK